MVATEISGQVKFHYGLVWKDWFYPIKNLLRFRVGVVGWIKERMRSNLLSEIESHFG